MENPGLHEDRQGYYLVSRSGIKYMLLEGKTIGGERELTSDYLIVVDDDVNDDNRSMQIIGWQFGATSINSDWRTEIEKNLLDMVENFEKRS